MAEGMFIEFENTRMSRKALEVSEAYQKDRLENPESVGTPFTVEKSELQKMIDEALDRS